MKSTKACRVQYIYCWTAWGALDKVENLPPYRIPTQCSHSNILKNIMVNCSNLSFARIFLHVKAHQDDHTGYESLTCSAQLNWQMDCYAKKAVWDTEHNPEAPTGRFPLKPSEVQSKMIFIGHQILSCHVLVVRSFFIF